MKFSKKIAYKMLRDRNPLLTTFADKLKVRDFVSSRIDQNYLTNLLWTGKDLSEFTQIGSLSNFVVKPNHGSHAAVIVSELTSDGESLPNSVKFARWSQYVIHPKKIELEKLFKLTNYWLGLNYYWEPNKLPEWAYLNIEPTLLVEELLTGPKGSAPDEYRFFMVHGKCELIYRFSNRFGNEEITIFDEKGNIMEGGYLGLTSQLSDLKMAEEFFEMLRIAESLSSEIDFIRVDLYLTAQGIKFSELTNYPMGGLRKFRPQSLEYRLALNWTPPY
jgi:hypothetical protein